MNQGQAYIGFQSKKKKILECIMIRSGFQCNDAKIRMMSFLLLALVQVLVFPSRSPRTNLWFKQRCTEL